MNNIEEILGTYRDSGESWSHTFERINSTRGIDLKTVYKVLAEFLDYYEQERPKRRVYEEPATVSTESGDVQSGVGDVKKEIPSEPSDTKDRESRVSGK